MGRVSSKATTKLGKAPRFMRLSCLSPILSRIKVGPACMKQRAAVDHQEDEEYTDVSLASSCSYNADLNTDIYQGSFLKFCKLGKQYQKFDKELKQTSCLSHHEGCTRHEVMEVINMEDLEHGLKTTTTPNNQSAQESTAFVGLGSSARKKYSMQQVAHMGNMSWLPVDSPVCEPSRRRTSESSLIDADDSKSALSYDGNRVGRPKGLPGLANSSTLYRSPDIRPNSRKPSMESSRESRRYERLSKELHRAVIRSPFRSPFGSRRLSMESLYGSGRMLFDPSLIAKFEEALNASIEANYDDGVLFNNNLSITPPSISAADTWASSETALDTPTVALGHRQERKLPASKIMPIDDAVGVKNKALLASYEVRCPPRGEGKVVLYFTSLRGVRKTFEDCCMLRLILRGLGVRVDERDVWMHSKYKEELMDVLGKRAMQLVPQLFVKGRYIGGAEEVKQLHEDGVLGGLMEELATGEIHSICEGCGDVRFIPCLSCYGSCKVTNEEYEVSRCGDCNENGLIMCPICVGWSDSMSNSPQVGSHIGSS